MRTSSPFSQGRSWELSLETGQLLGWVALAMVNAGVIATHIRMPIGGAPVRLLHHLFDAGHMLAAGLVSFAAVCLWRRWGPTRRRWAYLASFGIGLVIGLPALGDDVAVLASKLRAATAPMVPWNVLLVASFAATIPAAGALGRLCSRGWWKLCGLALFVMGALGNHVLLPHDYPGVHLFVAWGTAVLFGATIASPHQVPAWTWPWWVLRSTLAVPAILALVIVPSNAVALELYRSSASVIAPMLARIRADQGRTTNWKRSSNPWFNARHDARSVPPSQPPLLGKDAVLILITVDCLRADVLSRAEHLARLPMLRALREQSIVFTEARTVAPGTTVAIASLMTSRYYSQLYWTPLSTNLPDRVYPIEDDTVRFPEILSRAGIRSVNVQGLRGISQEFGLVRGMEDVLLPRGSGFAGAHEQVPVIIDKLAGERKPRMFFYAHFEDPHTPYDKGGIEGSAFERYLAEVHVVDREIERLVKYLKEEGLWDRTALIISSDHGEAFGEHGQKFHATTLYEELLRVPLLVRIPGLAPRAVQQPVSLVDIAPTILDLFGQPTPGIYMGESLVPLLRGERRRLNRPLAFESGRHMRAFVFPDGIKVIEDFRRRTLEIYDLSRDPAELENLYDALGAAGQERVEEMRRFFGVHALRREGYELPYAR